MNKKDIAALYLRVSRDDDFKGESNSIFYQRKILTKSALGLGYSDFIEFIDDGYSGTNFNRPGFKAMKQAILDGEICAVIVKDVSRLGRDYLTVGRYMEQFFPEHNIRFISVNDCIDSDRGEDDFAPFKNIMNEWYAKEASRKIRATWQAKGMSGVPLGPPLYGYKHDPDNPSLWIIDEPAARVVQYIYEMTLDGLGTYQIAAILKRKEILKPSHYSVMTGHRKPFRERSANPFEWSTSTINRILSSQEYCGDTLNFKAFSKSFKDNRRHNAPRDSWVVFENTHDPIIHRFLWKTIQLIREKRVAKKPSESKENIYTGLLKCADCGSNLHFHFNQRNPRVTYYNCSAYNRSGACESTHYIRTGFLTKIVTSELNYLTTWLEKDETKLVNFLYAALQQDSLRQDHDNDSEAVDKFVSLLKEPRSKLEHRILYQLIDYIEVYQSRKVGDGWTQRVDIFYTNFGKFRFPARLPSVSFQSRKNLTFSRERL